ncbi:MAG: hypothetical protein AVDCRST_MAG11-930, partial [uncultured Gemmatimonadaceae bacterium]
RSADADPRAHPAPGRPVRGGAV